MPTTLGQKASAVVALITRLAAVAISRDGLGGILPAKRKMQASPAGSCRDGVGQQAQPAHTMRQVLAIHANNRVWTLQRQPEQLVSTTHGLMCLESPWLSDWSAGRKACPTLISARSLSWLSYL
eukprot:GHUV01045106.1.p1 GENE.GHUV01045106.1~~GHUV01045106.1.p1  ORF type:complete len:124 (+),score=7.34 GHUV01045106.1:378-749(+)